MAFIQRKSSHTPPPPLVHSIITEEDADRVWSSVTTAVQVMAAEEEDGQV